MARTKQTARMSTGGKSGKASRNLVAGKGAKKSAAFIPLPQLDSTTANTQNSNTPSATTVVIPEPFTECEFDEIETISYDVSYESSFYAHYFKLSDFGDKPSAGDIFAPKFSCYKTFKECSPTQNPATGNAVVETKTPTARQNDMVEITTPTSSQNATYWFCLNFASSYDGPGLSVKNRPPLNIVIALDLSGSMSVPFPGENKSKIAVAKDCILSLTKQLRADDYFGLIIFTTTASVIQPLKKWSDIDEIQFAKTIVKLKPGGGTTLRCGLDSACTLLKGAPEGENRYSRICFLTDMEANESSDETSFIVNVQEYSREAVYTSIIGIGMNLSRKSVVDTSNTPGCNYCNVVSDENFRELMNHEFAFLVTPIAFNVVARITNKEDWSFYSGYGSPEICEFPLIDAKFSSVFPTSMDADLNARSGCFLFKLNKTKDTDDLPPLHITVDWEDIQGIPRSHTQAVPFDESTFAIESAPPVPPTPNTQGIRKAILLVNYTDFIKEQVSKYNAFVNYYNTQFLEPVTKKQKLSEETETPTVPSPPSLNDIQKFKEYFSAEQSCLEDPTLQGELYILGKIETFTGALPQ